MSPKRVETVAKWPLVVLRPIPTPDHASATISRGFLLDRPKMLGLGSIPCASGILPAHAGLSGVPGLERRMGTPAGDEAGSTERCRSYQKDILHSCSVLNKAGWSGQLRASCLSALGAD